MLNQHAQQHEVRFFPPGEIDAVPTKAIRATRGRLTDCTPTTAVRVLDFNASRHGFTIMNLSANGSLYVLAAGDDDQVSTSRCSVKILPGGYYEDPYGYCGEVFVIWDGNGLSSERVCVTEYAA